MIDETKNGILAKYYSQLLAMLLKCRLLKPLNRSCSPLLTKANPKLSTLDRSVEVVPRNVFVELYNKAEEKGSRVKSTGGENLALNKYDSQLSQFNHNILLLFHRGQYHIY